MIHFKLTVLTYLKLFENLSSFIYLQNRDVAKVKEDPWILSPGYGRKFVIARLRRALHYSQLPSVYCEAKRHTILIFLCAPAGVISCRFIVVLFYPCL